MTFFKQCSRRCIAQPATELPRMARYLAGKLGIKNFKARRDWVKAFKKRHPSLAFKDPRPQSALRCVNRPRPHLASAYPHPIPCPSPRHAGLPL